MRGAYLLMGDLKFILGGSSPRAWGIWLLLYPEPLKTAVHPHVRGVYACRTVYGAGQERFIPTCVGYMCSRVFLSGFGTVHPHVRGVYVNANTSFLLPAGSSPRAWGI